MRETVIKVEGLSKQYRLGSVGTGALAHDLNRMWHKVRGKEDPYLKIGESNDRSRKGSSEYVWALKDIGFEVKQGDVLGIIGRNGAGKSTLLKILSRTTSPTTGNIRVKGRIASLLEVGTGFHPELSGRENIFLNGAILGMSRREIKSKFDEIVDFAGVERYIDTPVKRYSSGMYVRLAFAVAAHLEPEILIVDEVLAVGDAEFQKKALGKMKAVSGNDGRTVLFVSHNMAAIRNLCTVGLLMQNGTVAFSGNIEQTISNYLLAEDTFIHRSIGSGTNRSGSGLVMFSDFYFESADGNKIDRIITGEDLTLVFKLKVLGDKLDKIDIGFSFLDRYEEQLGNLYSSYQARFFEAEKGTKTIKCTLKDLSFAPGKILVKGRIVVNGIESDWYKDILGTIDVEMGDFYKTGNMGQPDLSARYLFKGIWTD